VNAQEFKRKLTTIFSADVAGYSRLMGEDEAATVKTLEQYKTIMSDLIRQHRGRVVDSTGDNLLAEFASVVDAVQCAVATQKELQSRNTELPENRSMLFRIGINLGDVIEEDGRIYGDGVNIAARLESLADPGGICISKTAFDQIETKLPFGYAYLGEQQVKNIAKPVGAYKVQMECRVNGAEGKGRAKGAPAWRRKTVLSGVFSILVVLVYLAVWNFYWRAPEIEPAPEEKTTVPLSDKPSIAVLPFVNMSDDPKQDYFSDGISEDIINALVRWPPIRVIPRASSFIYKGKSIDLKQVGREMSVQYVLEGSTRREGNRVRITVQLIDTTTLQHLFSERYERDMQDIFAIQDEITLNVLTAMRISLWALDAQFLPVKGTENIDAYLKVLESEALNQNMNRANMTKSRQLAEEAIALDPEYSRGYELMAGAIGNEAMLGVYEKNPHDALERAIALAEKAVQLDDSSSGAHLVLGFISILLNRDYEKGIAEAERALDLAPNSVRAQYMLGVYLYWGGRSEEAIPIFKKAVALSPIPHPRAQSHLCIASRKARRYEEAVTVCRQLLQREPNHVLAHLTLAATFVETEKIEEARAEITEVLRIDPKYNVKVVPRSFPWKDQAEVDRLIDSLRKAGLPDKPPESPPGNPS
jgi:adenylate cyclase